MPKQTKRPKAPTIEQAQERATADINRWQQRQLRMDEDQRAFELDLDTAAQKSGEKSGVLFQVNDAPVLIAKFSRVLAKADLIIEYIGKHPDRAEQWQAIENWLRWLQREWEQEWHDGLNAPLQLSKAQQLLLRGWLCAQVRLRPPDDPDDDNDDDPPVSYVLYDAATVYPYKVGTDLVRVTRKWSASPSDLLADGYGKSEEDYSDLTSPQGSVTLHYQWSQGWEMVWGEGQQGGKDRWIKKPTWLGYNPWVITLAESGPATAITTSATSSTSLAPNGDRSRWMGTGVLERVKDYILYKSKLATMHMATIEGEANPSSTVYTDNNTDREFSTSPGARNRFAKDDRVELHRFGPNLNDWTAAMQIVDSGLSRGSAPSILWGENDNLPSGYLGALLGAGAADVLYPYVEALNLHDSMVYRKVLELVRDNWASPLRAYLKARADRPAGWAEVTYQDLKDEGTYVLISRNTMSRQERIALAQTATMLVDKKLIDLDTARGRNWLGEDDPGAIHQKVLSDMVLMDPQMVKAMIIPSLVFTGNSLAKRLYEMFHKGEIDQELAAGVMKQFQQAVMPGPGGQPVPTGQPPQGPPPPEQGQPTMLNGMVAPPQAQTGMQPGSMDPLMMMQLLQSLNGGAQGGAGYGGVPPQGVLPANLPMG